MPIDPINDEFVWRDEVVNREEIGNITCGYLGSAIGINETILYMGGGYAKKSYEINKNSNQSFVKNVKKTLIFLSPDLYNPSNFYGDDENDIKNIKIGIGAYENESH